LLGFLLAVLAGGFSMLDPSVQGIRSGGTAALFLGLVVMTAAVALELVESVLAGREISEELADLDDGAKRGSI
jgi:hypothetical protein